MLVNASFNANFKDSFGLVFDAGIDEAQSDEEIVGFCVFRSLRRSLMST